MVFFFILGKLHNDLGYSTFGFKDYDGFRQRVYLPFLTPFTVFPLEAISAETSIYVHVLNGRTEFVVTIIELLCFQNRTYLL